MKIKTKAYGEVEISSDNIINFEHGLLGFEKNSKFVILGESNEEDIFNWMQSIDDENLAFVVVQPRFFKEDYRPKIKAEEVAELDVQDESELLLLAIVTVAEDVTKMTANLLAPIIVNVRTNKAKQLVLHDEDYQIKTPILVED